MPPTSHYTQANSLRLHYLESGTPDPNVPPILLLHGFPTSSHLYRIILPELGKTHRAIALDLPGYGLSDKPLDAAYGYDFYADTLDAFLDALGRRDFIASPDPTEANVAACSGLIVVDEAGGAAVAKLLPNRPDVGRRRSVHGEEEA